MIADTQATVLLIDADSSARTTLAGFLESRYRIVLADNGKEGLRIYEQVAPACVLLDSELPDREYSALLDALIAKNAVVIVLTPIQSDDVGKEAVKRGAQDYYFKTALNSRSAVRMVAYAIERRRMLVTSQAAVEELRAGKQLFNDIAHRINEGLWVRDASGERCLYLSSAFQKIWGRSLEEMNRLGWASTLHPDDRSAAEVAVKDNTSSLREYQVSYRIVRPDGSIRFIENQGFPIINEQGEFVRAAGIARDVTEVRQMRNDLRLAQKLESVGQLAAGIAHEINTPSQYVSDNLSFLDDALQDLQPLLTGFRDLLDLAARSGAKNHELGRFRQLAEDVELDVLLEEIPAALQQSRHGIDQIKNIVRAMKDFSHPSDSKELVDLNKAIQSALTVARNEWKYVAELELNLDERLPLVSCVPSAINQVILHLIVNAAHAIGDVVAEGEKGTLRVATRSIEAEVLIQVEDSGSGIPDAIRERIFDPFFTTKEVGKGTGQGLAIAYSVVTELHGGSISVESAFGKGSRFIVSLPLRPPQEVRI